MNRYAGQRIGERDAVISGIGRSAVGRRLGRTGLSLTVESALAGDRGRGAVAGRHRRPVHLSRPDERLARHVAVRDLRRAGRTAGCGSTGSRAGARCRRSSVRCSTPSPPCRPGLANHVLIFRTVTESSAQTATRRASVVGSGGDRVGGPMQWMVPFHAVSAANWVGVYAQRYMHDYGLTREQLGQIPLNQRRHAARYDQAIFRDPLTMRRLPPRPHGVVPARALRLRHPL